MKHLAFITLLLVVFITLLAFTAVKKGDDKKLTADQIIDDYVTAMGGTAKLASITNIYMEGFAISGSGRKTAIRKWVVNKKAIRNESTFNGITSYTLVRSDSGWRYNPGRGQKAPEPLSANLVAAYKPNLDIEGPLVDYKAKGYKVTYVGDEEIEGTLAYKLEEVINDSLVKTFYVDPDSHYVMRVHTKSSGGGRVSVSNEDYSNYVKTSDGFVFPMAVGNAKYSLVKVNTEINDKLFKPIK